MNSKKPVCILLALSMCLGLAACGTAAETEPVKSVAPSPAEEYVYAAEHVQLDIPADSYLSVRGSNDRGFYATITEVVGEEVPEGSSPRYEGEYDVYGTFLFFVDYEGNVEKVKNYSALPPRENSENLRDFASGSSVSGMSFTEEGFVSIEQVYASWQEEGNAVLYSQQYWENQKYEQQYYIRHFDPEGNELSCAEIDFDNDADVWLDAYRMILDDRGNALVSVSGGIRAIAPDGSTAYTIPFEGYVDGFLRRADGGISALAYSESAGGYRLFAIDSGTGSMDGGVDVNFDAYSAVSGNEEYELCYSNGSDCYGYRTGAEEAEKLFSWLGCDVNGAYVTLIGMSSDGTVSGLVTQWDVLSEENSYELVRIALRPSSQLPEKEIITMAAAVRPYNIQDMIVEFNRSNDEYRIEIIDYSQQTDGDWEAAVGMLNADIKAGNYPDIYCLNGLNYTRLASMGLLEDLYPWIDGDRELDREDFFPNVLEAFEVDDKLCTTLDGIFISSVLGAAEVVGDEPGWTYEEYNRALAGMPAGCTAFDEYVTRDNMLHTLLALDMASFVDWGRAECSFDSDRFVRMLEFAGSFPAEFDWDSYNWETALSTEDRLAQGKQMLIQTSAYSIEDIFYNAYTCFLGRDVTYVGYPCAEGTGNMLQQSDVGYAMSAGSEHKEAVWQLLREFFTEEHHKTLYSLSCRIDVFEDMAEKAGTVRYELDEEGRQRLDEKGEPIPIVRYNMWDVNENKPVEIYALSQEQLDEVRRLMESTTKVADYNTDILNIVSEQAAPYFEGQKSAQETAKAVQNKVSAYMKQEG